MIKQLIVVASGLVAIAADSADGALGEHWLRINGFAAWELAIDHDLDGFTSESEYYAGSNPLDSGSTPSLSSPTVDYHNLEVFWSALLGVRYGVFESEDLVSWNATGAERIGDGNLVSAPFDGSLERLFFRLGYLQPLDQDGDALSGVEEALLGTRLDLADTDGDNIDDGVEVLVTLTDPLVPNLPAGTIRGRVFNDLNRDGDLADGAPLENVTVYLDANYNGRRDPGERFTETDAEGRYEFLEVQPGLHHVRQELPAPNVQTFPSEGVIPSFDLLPDEVVNYTHAAPGIGNFDEPYGENASEWPGEWGGLEFSAIGPEPTTPGVVLKPIGVRNRSSASGTRNGTEFLSLPIGAEITLRFEEPIINGPGPDFLIYSIDSGPQSEELEVFVGSTETSLISLGVIGENERTIPIDLDSFGVAGPVHFVKCVGQDLGGSHFGFDFVGIEAINIAPPDPGAHIVTIAATEIFENKNFGRYFRDLPPTVILNAEDGVPGTIGPRVGESLDVQIRAFDDLGVAGITLMANGQNVALGPNNTAIVPIANPGTVLLEATATDSGGQTTEQTTQVYVLNADGSPPFDPNRTGQGEFSNISAPRTRILSPGPGTVSSADLAVVAEIIGDPPATSWTVEYAPVDLVDPYDLITPDPDYIEIAAGTGNVYSSPVATVPLSSLADGIYFVRVCAQNSPTKVACFGQVIAKNVPEADLRPQVTIDSPAPGSAVTMTTDITGTITSSRPLVEWFAEYAPADQVDFNNLSAPDADWVRFASGTDPITTSAVIATFDGTMVKNNGYVVRIVARNDIGLGWAEPLALEVSGEAKLGRNRLEFSDISINLAGFPLEFVRVYDSLQADEAGELGFGWSFRLQDPDIRETVPDTGSFGLFGSTPFRDGTRIYITAPTGERLGYTFKPEVGASSGFGSVYRAVFEPDPGVYHKLEVPEGNLAFLDLKSDGNAFLFFFNFPYNPSRYVLTDPEGNRFTYHENKGFLQAEDRNGNKLTLSENGVEHSAGLSLTFERDGQGRITKVIDPGNSEWLYGYDANGDLTSVTDPEGRTTTYTYFADPAHYLDAIMDPLGRMPVRYEYDPASGRLLATIDEAGNRQEVNWDPAGFTGTITDRRGNVTQVEYDARGNITRKIDPTLNETLYEYGDPANPDRETAVVDARGMRYQSEYDNGGRLTRYKLPNVTGIAGANRLDLTYDAVGNVTRVRDFRNREWSLEWDANRNLTKYESPLAPSEINTWSPDGLLTGSRDDTGSGYAVSYEYDSNGQFACVRDTLGYRFDLELDKAGFPESATDLNGGSYDFDYDRSGLPLGQEDPSGMSTSLGEEADGSFTRTDRLGNSDNFMLASDGLLEAFTQPGGGAITPTYDENRNLASITDPNGNTTAYGYDAADLLASITDAAGNAISVTRDPVGLVTEIVDRNGKRRTFAYDDNRRITFERWLDGAGTVIREISYLYNGGNGSLDRVIDTEGSVVHEHSFGGVLPRAGNVKTTYHNQEEWTVDYGWSESGDVAPSPGAVSVRKGGSTEARILADYHGGRATAYHWNRPGNRNNRVEIRRTAAGAIASLRRFTGMGGSGNPISESLLTYDAMGRLQRIRHEDGAAGLIHPAAEISYGRDSENRLTTVTQAGNVATYSYDSLSQLTEVLHSDAALSDESYSYDVGGNRTSSHLLTTPAVVESANRLTSIGPFASQHDLEGNITRRTNTVTGEETNFTYDHLNRLVEATVHPSTGLPASDTLRFEYDFANRQISREINGIKTWVIYDRSMPIAEFADGATEISAAFFYSPDKIDDLHGVWREGIGERWFLKDHLGSIRGITDEDGVLLSWVDYDAFGNLQPGATPAAGETLRFAGRPFLEELGLYDNRRRLYDPLTGRFMQEDPTRMSGGRDTNLYRYAFNNPAKFTDPLGTSAALEQGLIDTLLSYAGTLCDFGDCVGNLWSGVVRGVVNVEVTDPTSDALNCAMDLMPIPDWPPNICEAVKEQVEEFAGDQQEEAIDAVWKFLAGGAAGEAGAEATKKAKTIAELVLKCSEATKIDIRTEEVGCPK